jgi:hypothetical protein
MKLIFVYNADSGLFNTLSDMAHKILSPKTYSCNLCMLTHDNFSVKQDWVRFLQTLNTETEFLHRDEFVRRYPAHEKNLPAIFVEQDEHMTVLVSRDEINVVESLLALQDLIRNKLAICT